MTRTSRETWLDEGLALLQQSGIDDVRIDTLCTRLNMTKGSFYHHFKNHEMFLEALLEHWEDKYTSQFIDHAEKGTTPLEKIDRLNKIALTAYHDPETHIRAWAITDERAKETVSRVDQRRIAYLVELYSALGYTPQRALVTAHVIYTTLIGTQYLLPQLKQDDILNMFSFIADLNFNTESGDTT